MNDDSLPAAEQPQAVHWFWILAAIGLTLALSFLWVLHDGINYQEHYDVLVSQQSHAGLFTWGSNDNPMPLYYLLLHGVNSLVGHASLYADRLVSLAAYVVLLVVAYITGRVAIGARHGAAFSVILLALSPFMVWYADRATVYSLLALITLLNQLFFILVLKRRWWALGAYIISGMLGLGIHYAFIAVLITQLLFLVYRRHDLGIGRFLAAIGSCLAMIASFGVWLAVSYPQSPFWHALPYTGKPSATNAFIIFVQYLFGFQSVVITTLIIALWPLLVLFALLAVQKYNKPPVGVQYLFISVVVPILGDFALSWFWKPLFLSSYLIICLPAFMLVLSWYLTTMRLKVFAIGRAVLVAATIVMLITELSNWQLALQEDYLGTAGTQSQSLVSETKPAS